MRCRVFFLMLCFMVCGMVLPTHAEPIRVSPAGPTIINLDEDAASVIVGNPVHATVVLDNPRTVMVNAGVSGMTNLIILGRDGKVILNRPVISGGATGEMIHVQNACINGGDGCVADKMFYCAEGERCYAVNVPQAQSTATQSAAQPSDNGGAGNSGSAMEDGAIQ